MPDKITINDRYFVPKGKMAHAILTEGDIPSGEYRRTRGGVIFYTPHGSPFASLTTNQWGERFFVSCVREASGRIRHLCGLASDDARRLGLIPHARRENRVIEADIAAQFA